VSSAFTFGNVADAFEMMMNRRTMFEDKGFLSLWCDTNVHLLEKCVINTIDGLKSDGSPSDVALLDKLQNVSMHVKADMSSQSYADEYGVLQKLLQFDETMDLIQCETLFKTVVDSAGDQHYSGLYTTLCSCKGWKAFHTVMDGRLAACKRKHSSRDFFSRIMQDLQRWTLENAIPPALPEGLKTFFEGVADNPSEQNLKSVGRVCEIIRENMAKISQNALKSVDDNMQKSLGLWKESKIDESKVDVLCASVVSDVCSAAVGIKDLGFIALTSSSDLAKAFSSSQCIDTVKWCSGLAQTLGHLAEFATCLAKQFKCLQHLCERLDGDSFSSVTKGFTELEACLKDASTSSTENQLATWLHDYKSKYGLDSKALEVCSRTVTETKGVVFHMLKSAQGCAANGNPEVAKVVSEQAKKVLNVQHFLMQMSVYAVDGGVAQLEAALLRNVCLAYGDPETFVAFDDIDATAAFNKKKMDKLFSVRFASVYKAMSAVCRETTEGMTASCATLLRKEVTDPTIVYFASWVSEAYAKAVKCVDVAKASKLANISSIREAGGPV
jgi:hypothetical protein